MTPRVVARIAKLRAERAVLLGYPNHAAYQLDDQTIGSVAAVNKLLADSAAPAVANARKEGRRHAGHHRPGKRRLPAGCLGLGFILRESPAGSLRFRRVRNSNRISS